MWRPVRDSSAGSRRFGWTTRNGAWGDIHMGFRAIVSHPARVLDDWWGLQAPKHRLDRGPSYICNMIPIWLYSLSTILFGPVPNSSVAELPDYLQMMLAFCIFMGATICLYGTIKPRADPRYSYRLGYSAAPATSIGLFVYGWAIINDTPNWTSAFAGLVGPFMGIGALLNALGFWLEIRRLNRVDAVLKLAGEEQGDGPGNDSR